MAIGHLDYTQRGFRHIELAILDMMEVEGQLGAMEERDVISQILE